MKEQGWIKLHRKLKDNPIFYSDKGLRVWMWCLLKAGHKDKDIYLGNEKIHLKSGQFITGRLSASEELKISPSTFRNMLTTLKQDRYLDIKTTNKYSIITILNWSEYQNEDSKKDNRITTERHKQECKNDKNNISKDILVQLSKVFNFPFKENKTAYSDVVKLINRFGDSNTLLAFARKANSFEDFPYVIESPGALYRKADKILMRLKQQKDIEKDKMYYGGQEVNRIRGKLMINGLEFGGQIKDIINYKK